MSALLGRARALHDNNNNNKFGIPVPITLADTIGLSCSGLD